MSIKTQLVVNHFITNPLTLWRMASNFTNLVEKNFARFGVVALYVLTGGFAAFIDFITTLTYRKFRKMGTTGERRLNIIFSGDQCNLGDYSKLTKLFNFLKKRGHIVKLMLGYESSKKKFSKILSRDSKIHGNMMECSPENISRFSPDLLISYPADSNGVRISNIFKIPCLTINRFKDFTNKNKNPLNNEYKLKDPGIMPAELPEKLNTKVQYLNLLPKLYQKAIMGESKIDIKAFKSRYEFYVGYARELSSYGQFMRAVCLKQSSDKNLCFYFMSDFLTDIIEDFNNFFSPGYGSYSWNCDRKFDDNFLGKKKIKKITFIKIDCLSNSIKKIEKNRNTNGIEIKIVAGSIPNEYVTALMSAATHVLCAGEESFAEAISCNIIPACLPEDYLTLGGNFYQQTLYHQVIKKLGLTEKLKSIVRKGCPTDDKIRRQQMSIMLNANGFKKQNLLKNIIVKLDFHKILLRLVKKITSKNPSSKIKIEKNDNFKTWEINKPFYVSSDFFRKMHVTDNGHIEEYELNEKIYNKWGNYTFKVEWMATVKAEFIFHILTILPLPLGSKLRYRVNFL